jgi:hypothetical protein
MGQQRVYYQLEFTGIQKIVNSGLRYHAPNGEQNYCRSASFGKVLPFNLLDGATGLLFTREWKQVLKVR